MSTTLNREDVLLIGMPIPARRVVSRGKCRAVIGAISRLFVKPMSQSDTPSASRMSEIYKKETTLSLFVVPVLL